MGSVVLSFLVEMAQAAQKTSHSTRPNETSVHAGEATALGLLGTLPYEIRRMTYLKCHLSTRILRVNTTVYFEYLESLQRISKFGSLRLHVDPSKHPSTVQITTEFGRPCGSIDAASSHLHLNTNPIRTMPVGRYSKIIVEIDAPNPNDPGQAIRLCKQVAAIVTSLSPTWFPSTTSGIPTTSADCLFPRQMKIANYIAWLVIRLKETPSRSWKKNGKWNQSLADYDEGWFDERLSSTGNGNSDVGMILQLLLQLRGVKVFVGVPRSPFTGRLEILKYIIDSVCEVQTPFGLNWYHGFARPGEEGVSIGLYPVRFSDSKILEKIQSLQIWQEFLLDDLPGRSADLLRKERFLRWCGVYERQHAQSLYGIPPRPMSEFDIPERPGLHIAGAHEWIDIDLWELIEASFHSRFWAMMSCDLSQPTGVERKSKNRLWTDFLERPLVKVHALMGFYVSTDEKWSMRRRWREAAIDCTLCRVEADRTERVFAQKGVRGMIEELSSSTGLGNYFSM